MVKIKRKEILLTTTDDMHGYKIIETIGLIQGSTIQTRWIGRDFTASLKQLIGGELKGYNVMLQNARRTALKRMIDQARQLESDAVVGIRFSSNNIMQNAAEILAYGTAVKIKKVR